MFNLTANNFFDRHDLLQGTPEGAYRMARSTILLVMRVGEGVSSAERAADKVLHGQAHADISTQLDSPYGTRSKAVSSFTPNLSILQHSVSPTPKAAKHWCPPSPIRPTIDPTALRPLPREESGLLRGRRGVCLCWLIWEDCKGECYAFTRKATATDTQEG